MVTRLEVWILLDDCHQLPDLPRQCRFNRALLANAGCLHGFASQSGDTLHDTAFIVSIRSDCLDQIWNQIVPAFELHIDPTPSLGHSLIELNEAIIDPDKPPQQSREDEYDRHRWRARWIPSSSADR